MPVGVLLHRYSRRSYHPASATTTTECTLPSWYACIFGQSGYLTPAFQYVRRDMRGPPHGT
ncbi:uncharacterized protein BJ212DRAFT_1414898 [Suillus subaureus]|uniref:Uncharacterized protein n=1 Tax=Suillus subaureus TaxID=48587 RepID=A0A9P7APQ6_9AGAM|nr:uncharacterized protein BJ212DRAFT_1414898 [Suillus subaureus]KAG1793732.1 hypothetical protein BJ212DRAFT_1414898 [Suillus subaureus]